MMTTPIFSMGDMLNAGRYRVERKLGEGGFGEVYLAIHLGLQTQVALKVTTDTSPESQQGFLAEAQLLSKLSHPHLPRVTDFFIEGQQPCLVMDYIPGKDLDQLLQERGAPFREAEVRGWVAQILDALSYLHSQHPPVIHRDIKPSNMRLAEHGRVYLVDFGIAKVGGETTRTQRAGQAATPHFSPPEQYGGTLRTDARSDIYALGATLYALLTKKLPPDISERTIGVPFPSAQHDFSTLSAQMGAIIARTMQLNPADRYTNVQELAQAFAPAVAAANPVSVVKTQVIQTGKPCPRCGQLPITAHSPFCHACGTPILLAFPSVSRLLDSPTDLVATCDAAWPDALKLVQSGALARWLEAHGHTDLLSQIRTAQAQYPADAEAALEIFLRPNPPQDLEVTPSKVDFGVCQPATQAAVTLTIRRQSPGFVHGAIQPEARWLTAPNLKVRLGPTESQMQVDLHVATADLMTDDVQRSVSSSVVIRTNRGTVQLPVTVVVTNPPQIRISETAINLGTIESSRRVSRQVVIMNAGGGTISGRIGATQAWLTIEAQHAQFNLNYHQQATVQFGVMTDHLTPQGVHQGTLRWETNLGTYSTTVQLEVTPPYRLNIDDPATAIKQRSDLIKLCDAIPGKGDAHWSRGLEWLRTGRMVEALRFLGEQEFAQRVARMVQQDDLNLALENLLRECGAKPARSYKDNGGEVGKQIMGMFSRKPPSVVYAILNTSKRGYLHGYLKPLVDWLTIPQPRFGCLPGEEATVEILPDYKRRAFGDLFDPIIE